MDIQGMVEALEAFRKIPNMTRAHDLANAVGDFLTEAIEAGGGLLYTRDGAEALLDFNRDEAKG